MATNNYAPIWDTLRLGHPKPVLGARLISLVESDDMQKTDYEIEKTNRPDEMRCVFYSSHKSAYYVVIKRNGKRYKMAFFDTAEAAITARDELLQSIGAGH